MTTTTATRDRILGSRTGEFDVVRVTSEQGTSYIVLGPAAPDAVWAIAPVTGILLRVQRTGTANVRGKGEQVRARFEFATDTGDAAGTLAFDRSFSVAGVAPRALFGDL